MTSSTPWGSIWKVDPHAAPDHQSGEDMTHDASGFVRSTPFEVATCWLHGLRPPRPLPSTARTPREALADVIRPALIGGRCFVTFSGGRDSSAVLAAATALARAEGHPDPIPVTRRYPGIPDTDETSWQELVVEHLGLREWLRLELTDDETDLLGPTAQASLRRHGVLWPPAVHSHGVVYEHIRDGAMLTGEGGDEVFGVRRVTPLTLLRRRRRPTAELVRWAGRSLLPQPARAALVRRELARTSSQTWLTPTAAEEHYWLLAADEAAEPLRYDRAVWWVGRKRVWQALEVNQGMAAAEYGITTLNPLVHPEFLAALADAGGRWGYNGRTAVMKALFSDVLPPALLSRSSKSSFNHAYSGRFTREFAREWDGTGVDPRLVDVAALRSQWLSDSPTMGAAMLLHAAWLSTPAAREIAA